MVADRNGNVREFLRRELTGEGYVVRLASNGYELLRALWSEYPSLLILDPDLPLLAESRALAWLAQSGRLPVLFHGVPGARWPEEVVEHAFVEKGSSPVELKSWVARLLSGDDRAAAGMAV